jgi:hypothetical protein
MAGRKKSCANLNVADLMVRSMAQEDLHSISPRWSEKPLDLEEMKEVMRRWQLELEGRGWPRVYLTSRNCSKGGTQPFERSPGFRRAVFSQGSHFRLARRHGLGRAKDSLVYATLRRRVVAVSSRRRRHDALRRHRLKEQCRIGLRPVSTVNRFVPPIPQEEWPVSTASGPFSHTKIR